jgi:cytochrome c oxidase subunit 2
MRSLAVYGAGAALAALVVGGGPEGRVRAAAEPRVVAITAKRFDFTPSEVTLKVGETVELRLTTDDVSHGFFVKPLGIDELIVPGKTTEIVLTPRAAGRYTTICDRFCGAGHGGMKMTIVVEGERSSTDE